MTYSVDVPFNGSYMIDKAAIVDLWETAESYLGSAPEIVATLAGDHRVTLANANELVDDVL